MDRASLSRLLAPASAVLLLAACASAPKSVEAPRPAPPSVPAAPAVPAPPGAAAAPTTPLARPLLAADWRDLPGWGSDAHDEAWPAFLQSCRSLGRQATWQGVCDAAKGLGEKPSASAARSFFESRLTPWRVTNADGTKEGLITGYYEPLLQLPKSALVVHYMMQGLDGTLAVANLHAINFTLALGGYRAQLDAVAQELARLEVALSDGRRVRLLASLEPQRRLGEAQRQQGRALARPPAAAAGPAPPPPAARPAPPR